ncbi:MAG: PAQR family membrane homeostasis protein TrhA [Bacillota bacterium]|jgi:hemolysin III
MKRTPIKSRSLPDYTKGEECMNMITHIVGGSFGVIILVICILTAAAHHNVWGIVSSSIYGFSLIALYAVSSVYHGLPSGHGKKVMQIIDHCTIYMLIAGTYTPILLAGIRPLYPVLAWVIFGAEWGLAAIGAALNGIDLKKYSKFSMICYIGMGWLIIIALKPTIEALTWSGFLWVLAGGIAYTLGAVLYGLGKKQRYLHSVFHIFVIFGSILQAVAIIVYVL